MKKVDIGSVKQFSRGYLKENGHLVFRYRELIVESDEPENPENKTVYRFKSGDGITPYRDLKYESTLYSLLPYVCLYDKEYETCVTIHIGGDD